ncbi:hypothetical protein LBBP_04534 (plasmid) [Leptospira borgpetersenii serovar Ballum]|uniref:Uncharacterized protein n=1 Tax=Leptospira borgpetersenii serovar Ballum TaxID=280505 RepID=A0A0S2IM35_LEPBO|nr:hypothetical protein LBBP_00374 [Leptospira borgpetersenii serovar Ballum]ALO28630.1 hypothetical protein LBBP_04534 [Leptospira borgpetersenii serovar Ballum]
MITVNSELEKKIKSGAKPDLVARSFRYVEITFLEKPYILPE